MQAMQGKGSTARDVAAGIFVAVALAMPFASMLWDGAARMKVHFRTSEMEKPRAFSTETSKSVCTVMAAALSYEDPSTGEYTHVACSE
jgi:hypothetical protein